MMNSTQQSEGNGGTPLAEPTGSAIMVSDGEKLAKGDEYLCDDGTWKPLEAIWTGVTYTKWLMVPMRRPNIRNSGDTTVAGGASR